MKTSVQFSENGKSFIAIKVRKGAEQFRLEEFYKSDFGVQKTVGHFSYNSNQIRFEVESPLSLYIVGFATSEQKQKLKIDAGILFAEDVSEVPDFATYQRIEELLRKQLNEAETIEEMKGRKENLETFLKDNEAILTAQRNYQEAWEEVVIFELK